MWIFDKDHVDYDKAGVPLPEFKDGICVDGPNLMLFMFA